MVRGKPMSQFPRGPRRIEARAATRLEVPVASPHRQLHVLRAFIKPHDWTREAIRHRLDVDADPAAEQPWRAEWELPFAEAARAAAGRLHLAVEIDAAADATETYAAVDFPAEASADAVRAVATACSARLPEVWMTLGQLYLRGGQFWRRERGRGLSLRRATNVHVPREIRATLRDLLSRPRSP